MVMSGLGCQKRNLLLVDQVLTINDHTKKLKGQLLALSTVNHLTMFSFLNKKYQRYACFCVEKRF
jgi:hypothetical protein